MPRVYFVKAARKDNPVAKKGESYYWWKHAFRPKQFSKTHPKPSQLTGSAWLSNLYGLLEGLEVSYLDFDTLESTQQETVDELQSLLDKCQDSLDNMPEHLQESSQSGETLRERIDELESAISNIESLTVPSEEDFEGKDNELDEWKTEQAEEFKQELIENFPQL